MDAEMLLQEEQFRQFWDSILTKVRQYQMDLESEKEGNDSTEPQENEERTPLETLGLIRKSLLLVKKQDCPVEVRMLALAMLILLLEESLEDIEALLKKDEKMDEHKK